MSPNMRHIIDNAERRALEALHGFDAATITYVQQCPRIQRGDLQRIRIAKKAWRKYVKLTRGKENRPIVPLEFAPME